MDRMREAWLNLVAAEEQAKGRARGKAVTDDWHFIASQLGHAQLLLEIAVGDGFGAVEPGEERSGTCADLAAAALAALCAVPYDQEPPQLAVALIVASDAQRAIVRQPAPC